MGKKKSYKKNILWVALGDINEWRLLREKLKKIIVWNNSSLRAIISKRN